MHCWIDNGYSQESQSNWAKTVVVANPHTALAARSGQCCDSLERKRFRGTRPARHSVADERSVGVEHGTCAANR